MDYKMTLSSDSCDKLLKLTIQDEGYRQFPYRDAEGVLTMGIGFNIESTGITLEESVAILKIRFPRIELELINCIPIYSTLTDIRKIVLLEMAYEHGIEGLCKFNDLIKALNAQDYQAASKAMLDSKWAKTQSPLRATKYAMMMELGRL